jgi:hypothetical protein
MPLSLPRPQARLEEDRRRDPRPRRNRGPPELTLDDSLVARGTAAAPTKLRQFPLRRRSQATLLLCARSGNHGVVAGIGVERQRTPPSTPRTAGVTQTVRSQQREAAALALGRGRSDEPAAAQSRSLSRARGRRVLATVPDPGSTRWLAADLVDTGQADRVASGVRAFSGRAHRYAQRC